MPISQLSEYRPEIIPLSQQISSPESRNFDRPRKIPTHDVLQGFEKFSDGPIDSRCYFILKSVKPVHWRYIGKWIIN